MGRTLYMQIVVIIRIWVSDVRIIVVVYISFFFPRRVWGTCAYPIFCQQHIHIKYRKIEGSTDCHALPF